MTVSCAVHVPIWVPSGEQMGWPAVVQDPVEEPVEAMLEVVAGATLGLDELLTGAATEGEAAAGPATEGEAATAGAAADIEGAAAPELPELPALEASVPEELDELPDAPHLGPVGGAKASALLALAISTEAPGSGNLRSAASAVVQSVTGMFATNISGNEAVARSESSGTAYS